MRLRSILVAAALALGVLSVPTTADAAAKVTVRNEFGKAQADLRYGTKLTLSGRGFQSIQGGHGGIYVFFGTVKSGWRPSHGGRTGQHYLYVPDSETKNNSGYQRFISFPGNSGTGSAAHGTMKSNGSWSATINVPGATFKTVDRNGKVRTVDCRTVRCGVITIGAHGVTNARNETFTPVSFGEIYGDAGESSAPGTAEDEGAVQGEDGDEADEAEKKASAADAGVFVDTRTAVAGRVLSFTGSGFSPGEQVIATLDDGLSSAGPLTAGPSGEVAGLLQIPEDVAGGTHELRLTGAASGASPSATFPITVPLELQAASAPLWDRTWVQATFLGIAILVFAGALLFAIWRIRRIRRSTRQEVAHAAY